MKTRQTLFSDVCGTMDELKRLHHEEYDHLLEDPPALVSPLLEDARYMLAHMGERLREYDGYRARLRSALQQVEAEANVDLVRAQDALAFFDKIVGSSDRYAATEVGTMAEAAEAIRSVASGLEHRLRVHMELALETHRLFQEMKGERPWVLAEEETGSYKEALEAKYQSWLPSEPHRALLLDMLATSGAGVREGPQPGSEPVIQFEDGGSIAMSQVRYDATVRNFYPAGHKPAPGGRLYRRAVPAERPAAGVE